MTFKKGSCKLALKLLHSLHDFTFFTMSVCVAFIFICAGLRGIQSLNTVSHISMEVGGTVQIPCLYEEKYMDNVKYLCRGFKWNSCEDNIRSDQTNSAKYSIDDDKKQRIVTFTVKNLELKDSDHYWCNIERTGTDDGERFQLSVTRKGESKLSVDSQLITGYFDGQITINCKYKGSGLRNWCRVGGPCRSFYGIINGAEVSIDKSVDGVFAVTMTGLKAQTIGWYWCAFRDLQMPVFLQVTERPTTSTTSTTMVTATTVKMSALSTNKFETASASGNITALHITAIALGLLIIIAIVSLVAWFTLKRKEKKSEVETSASPECADYPVYGNVNPRPPSHQNSSASNEMQVLYSDVTFINNQASQKGAVKEEDVLYSTLA